MENVSERRNNYIKRLENFNRNLKVNNLKSPKEIIAEGVRKSSGISDEATVNMLSDKALKGEHYVKDGNYDVFLFGIAESLENIRCETSPQNEYFSWIDDSKMIMDHLTDGDISESDLRERDLFIDDSWQRETEILTCLSLYESSNNPLAKQRKDILLIKLLRLRQIRSALNSAVKDKAESTKENRYKAAMYALALNKMKKSDMQGDYYNSEVLQNLKDLNIDHADDVEFYDNYSFYTRILEEQKKFNIQKNLEKMNLMKMYSGRPDECLTMLRHEGDTEENIRERIARLSGIRGSARQSVGKISTDNVYKKRLFNADKFMHLKEKYKEKFLNSCVS